MLGFEGKVAWVAGAARPPGIGAAVAVQLARVGADVVCVDMVAESASAAGEGQSYVVTADALHAVGAAVAAEGRRALVQGIDVSDPAAVDGSVAAAVEAVGRIDVCCNLSGGTGPALGNGLLLDLEPDSWGAALDANLTAAWLGSRACARQMVEQGDGGAIVNLASSAALVGSTGFGAFSVARAGVVRLTDVLARELGPHGIRVNAVCPRGVSPDAPGGNPGLTRGIGDASKLEAWARRTVPLGRLQTPDETAAVVVFLASDAASFVSGQAIGVMGGAHAGE